MTENSDVERYLAGALSAEDAARFEEAMIERPALAADVDVRRRIKAGLALLDERKELEPFLQPVRQTHYFRYAAAVLVVAAGFVFTLHRAEGPMQALFNTREIGTSRAASSFILTRTRSDEVPTVEVQRGGGFVRLRVVVEPEAAPFTMHLIATGNADASQIKEVLVTETTDGFADIYVDPSKLQSGAYTLAVKPGAGAEQQYAFSLRVLP